MRDYIYHMMTERHFEVVGNDDPLYRNAHGYHDIELECESHRMIHQGVTFSTMTDGYRRHKDSFLDEKDLL